MSNAKVLGQWMLVGGLTMVAVGGIGILSNRPLPRPAGGAFENLAYTFDWSGEQARRSNARAGAIGITSLGVVATALGAALRAGASRKPDQAALPQTGSVGEFINNVKSTGLESLKAAQNYASTLDAKSHLNPSLRPTGIVLIALYTAFSGGLLLLIGTSVIVTGLSLSNVLYAVGAMSFGIISLLAAYGLWGLAPWGYYFSILIYCVSIPWSFSSLLFGQKACGSLFFTLFSVAIAVVILRYLSSPRVKSFFISGQAQAPNPVAQADG